MTRSEFPIEHVRQTAHGDQRALISTGWIHLADAGSEQQIAALLLEQVLIIRERTRICCVVLARTELQRIDEDTCHHAIRATTRGLEQAHMAGVQIAHRRYERD